MKPRLLTERVEDKAIDSGYEVLTLDVRESQSAAIQLYESMGYVHWGTNPHYARVDGEPVAGHHYYKELVAAESRAVEDLGTAAEPVAP